MLETIHTNLYYWQNHPLVQSVRFETGVCCFSFTKCDREIHAVLLVLRNPLYFCCNIRIFIYISIQWSEVIVELINITFTFPIFFPPHWILTSFAFCTFNWNYSHCTTVPMAGGSVELPFPLLLMWIFGPKLRKSNKLSIRWILSAL